MKIILTSILIFAIRFVVYCSVIPPVIDTGLIFPKIRALAPTDKTFLPKKDFFKSITFLSDSVFYYNPQGTLHLFEINLSPFIGVKKLSRSIYHGHNFNRYNFIYDTRLYSLGGTGLFGSCSDLIIFDFKAREWFKVEVKNKPQYIKEILTSWVYDDTLNFVFSKKHPYKVRLNPSFGDYVYGQMDLANNTYYEVGVLDNIKPGIIRTDITGNLIFESKHYQIFQSNRNNNFSYWVFDKKNKGFFTSKIFSNKVAFNGISYHYANNNKLFYRSLSGTVDSAIITDESKIDTHSYFNLFKPLNPNNDKGKKGGYFYVYLLMFFILVLLVVFFIKTKAIQKINVSSLKKEGNNSTLEIIEIENNLIQYKHKLINRSELDSSLRITHLSFDTMKAKRSVLLKTINARNKVKVDGRRTEVDKLKWLLDDL